MKTSKPSITFSDEESQGLYKAIFNRRDVRSEFKADPIPDEVLSRILYAAHHAPSVGFMQPWDFIMITDNVIKNEIHQAFSVANKEAEAMFDEAKQSQYRALKLEGILNAPVNLCITCDRNRAGPVVLGRTHNEMMDMFSTVCAVQNLWLAARTEGLGVGWVSIFKENALQEILGIPEHVVPIAYLCIGYVDDFYDQPELEVKKWRSRMPLEDLISFNEWSKTESNDENNLIKQIIEDKDFPKTC